MVSQLTSVVKNTDDIRFLSIGTLCRYAVIVQKRVLGLPDLRD